MIPPAQAKTIANDIASRENAVVLEARNAAAPRVPYYYRCDELGVLEPWQRAEVVRAAERAVIRDWRVIIGLLLWVVVCVSGWFLLAASAIGGGFLGFLFVTCLVPLFVVRTTLIRRRVAEIARSYAPSMLIARSRRD